MSHSRKTWGNNSVSEIKSTLFQWFFWWCGHALLTAKQAFIQLLLLTTKRLPSDFISCSLSSQYSQLTLHFKRIDRGYLEIIANEITPFKSNGRQIRPSITTHSNSSQKIQPNTSYLRTPQGHTLSYSLSSLKSDGSLEGEIDFLTASKRYAVGWMFRQFHCSARRPQKRSLVHAVTSRLACRTVEWLKWINIPWIAENRFRTFFYICNHS